MTTNEILARQNFILKIPFKNGEDSLSKDLKVKIMGMRIEYGKVRKSFNEDLQEFIQGVTPPELNELQSKTDKTAEDESKIKEIVDKINLEYNDYIKERNKKEYDVKEYMISEDEFNEIVVVMTDDEIQINENKITLPDYLEILHDLFVK